MAFSIVRRSRTTVLYRYPVRAQKTAGKTDVWKDWKDYRYSRNGTHRAPSDGFTHGA